ncbi:MAG: hypothetical protein NXY59_08775 [Aigarchaeota archaeon]|nr:hypothetical protein [Candidatus Pelearchaeum maunauluense]
MSDSDSLGVEPSNSLILHEEVIPSVISSLSKNIRAQRYVIHPVIIDGKSLMVIDGMHRVAALQNLGIPLTPVYRVDYLGSSNVRLYSWCRVVSHRVGGEYFREMARELGLCVRRVSQHEAREGLEKRRYAVCIMTHYDGTLALGGEDQGVWETYQIIAMIDELIRSYGLSYSSEEEAMRKFSSGDAGCIYLVPRLKKEEVLEIALSGRRLPPKSTRHIVDNRSMFVFAPLELLKLERSEAESRLAEWLSGSRAVKLPPGQVIDREYEETIVVYLHARDDVLKLYPPQILELVSRLTSSP